MSVTVEQLQATIRSLAKGLPIFTGKLNPSKPRADGGKGSAFYGSIDLVLAHPELLEQHVKGQSLVKINLAVFPRTNKETGEVFYVIEASGIYDPEKKKDDEVGGSAQATESTALSVAFLFVSEGARVACGSATR